MAFTLTVSVHASMVYALLIVSSQPYDTANLPCTFGVHNIKIVPWSSPTFLQPEPTQYPSFTRSNTVVISTVIAVVVFVALATACVWWFLFRRRMLCNKELTKLGDKEL